jgi:CBS domain containing-hemolysin-like protein
MQQATALVLAFALVLLNAFFVAAEFALVKIRATRVEELTREGVRRAQAVRGALRDLDAYLSATQLGITLASLGLGWIGEPAFAWLLERPAHALGLASPRTVESLALGTAFATITFLHIVLGELAPKSLAIQRTERVALWVGMPLRIFFYVFYPALWVLNHSAALVLRLLGITPARPSDLAHSEEELRMLLSESHRFGALSEVKKDLLESIFDYSARTARHVMIPRADIVFLQVDRPWEENVATIRQHQHTRYPLCAGDLDHVVGMIHVKDLFNRQTEVGSSRDLMAIKREILFVPGSRRLDLLQRDFQQRRVHMAIVIDEYGGTAGLVTLEDVIEEIVGEIQDEFDREPPKIEETPEGHLIDGLMLADDVAQYFGLRAEESEVNTLGGYVTAKLGRIPRVGDSIRLDSLDLRVVEMKGRRVAKLLAVKRLVPTVAAG